MAAGVLYGIIALIVMQSGVGWVERLMPPVVTGAVVAAIGLNLAPVAVKAVSGSQFDTCIGLITVVIVGLVAVSAPGLWRRLPVIIGAIAGYLLYLLLANVLGLGKPIDYAALAAAPWIGLPKFTTPSFHANAVFLIAPVAIILVAENLGHIKAIGAMTGRSLDPFLGRAFLGDSLATIVSALGRRTRGDDLRRKYRGYGRDEGLLDPPLCGGRRSFDPVRIFAQVWCLDPINTRPGHRRSVAGAVWVDRGDGRPDLGGEPMSISQTHKT